jgi:WD40 repeat protein
MPTLQSFDYSYQVGGCLPLHAPSYVQRQTDEELYRALLNSEFCYVLNSRQMGKSSLRVQAMRRLQADGILCGVIDITSIGTQQVTPEQWYASMVRSLATSFQLKANIRKWWQENSHLPLVNRLSEFIEKVLLVEVKENIVIFIDEIDSVLGLQFPIDDFFAFIRSSYNKRAENTAYNRLTFALLGVITPSDLIADKNRTPFNIGRAIELKGFEVHEAMPLLPGLFQSLMGNQASGDVGQPMVVLEQILYWTGGQPFLTQKLCQLVVTLSQNQGTTSGLEIPFGEEKLWVEQLVRKQIIDNWESRDEPEHLKTIRDRLLKNEQKVGRLLGLYQQILLASSSSPLPGNASWEQVELILSGLVVKHQGFLKIRNPIYQAVFNQDWVSKQLEKLRPYGVHLNAWLASGCSDDSRLLRGKALQEALSWSESQDLSNQDYQFLAKSQELDRQEEEFALEKERLLEVKARLAEEEKRLAQKKQNAKRQKFLLFLVSKGLLVASILGAASYFNYRQAVNSEVEARISEIQVLASSSGELFASNQKFDALIKAIKAKRKLLHISTGDSHTKAEVESVLRQAVTGADEYNRLPNNATLLAVAWSKDGQTIATAGMENVIKLWRADGTLLKTLKSHTGAVRSIQFTPDSQMIVSGSDDHTLKLWGLDGSLLQTIEGHKGAVQKVAISPDGETIASAADDNTIKLWHKDGTFLRSIQAHEKLIHSIAFSPKGETIVSGSADKTVKIWRLRDGSLLQTLKGHTVAVLSLAISPDGEMIASGSGDQTIKLWVRDNKQGGKGDVMYRPYATLTEHTGVIWALAFSPDGNTFASASCDETIKLWNRNGSLLKTFKGHKVPVWGLAFSPDGSAIASVATDNVAKLWKTKNPLLTTPYDEHNVKVLDTALNSNGKTISLTSEDKTDILWNSQRSPQLNPLYKGCAWVEDYLHNNPEVKERDRHLCDGVIGQ